MSELQKALQRIDALDRARPCPQILSTENLAFYAEVDKHWDKIREALRKV